MTTGEIELTKETLPEYLVAYLDGELEPETVREVERLLAEDNFARALLEKLKAQSDDLSQIFRAPLEEPVPLALAGAIKRAPMPDSPSAPAAVPDVASPSRRWWLVAASVAALAVGIPGGFIAGQRQSEREIAGLTSWLRQVAQYHRVYGQEQRHLVEVGAHESEHIQAWLGKRLGRSLPIPDLSEDGLEFKGARMLVVNGQPVAQLMYLAEGGRPVGLCLIKSAKSDRGFITSQADDLNLVDWRASGYGFVVIGWDDPQQLEAIAARSRKTFDL